MHFVNIGSISQRTFLFFLIGITVTSFFFWNRSILGTDVLLGDGNYYDRVAVSLGGGLGFYDPKINESQWFVGYSAFLSGLYAVFGHSYDAVRYVQLALFIFVVLLIYALGVYMNEERAARITAMFGSVFYVLPLSAGAIHREMLITFLVMVSVYALVRAHMFFEARWFVVSGISVGLLAVVADVTKFLWIPLTVAILIFVWRENGPRALWRVGLFVLCFFFAYSPVLFKNITDTGTLGITEKGGGLSGRAEFMRALTPEYGAHFVGHALGYYFAEKLSDTVNPRAFRDVPTLEERLIELKNQGLTEHQIDRVLFEEGKASIFEHPFQYLGVSVLDWISFNSPLVPNDTPPELSFIHLMFAEGRHAELPEVLKGGFLLLIRFLWFAALALGVYGAIYIFTRSRDARFSLICIVLVVFYFNVVYSLVHAIPRYAIPIYPFYILLTSVGLVAIWRRFRMVGSTYA